MPPRPFCAPDQPYSSDVFPKSPSPPEQPLRPPPLRHKPEKGNPDRREPPKKPPSPLGPKRDPDRTPDALRARYVRFMPTLTEIMAKRFGEELAEVAVQDAWLKIHLWVESEKAAAHTNPEALFLTAAQNIILTLLRQANAHRTVSLPEDTPSVERASDEDDEPIAPERVRSAVAALPERYQIVINAIYRDGLSGRKIEKRYGIPEASVRRWHASALDLLREILTHS